MIYQRSFVTRFGRSVLGALSMVLALSLASAQAQQPPTKPATGSTPAGASGFIVPVGVFSQSAGDSKLVPIEGPSAPASGAQANPPVVPSAALVPKVLLYASLTTRAFLASGGFDAADSVRTWEVFLRKYQIPFQVVSSVDQLEKLQPGVLLLPSAVALSERERLAVIDFRSKGGSVLGTWLTGVRSENGAWRGFGFMESALDVKVVGNTEGDKDDTFLIPHGDNPVTHALPAGLRVWLEHAKDWYPLRLLGRQTAANIMDWSRSVSSKSSSTITFDERVQLSGRLSRSVVLGYPERLWRSADPKALEAIAHNALMWLLHQPDAYLSNWPHPYGSATVVAVGSSDVGTDLDAVFAKLIEDAGGRGTYYLTSEGASMAVKSMQPLQAKGHEVAYYGDRFLGFKDQPVAVQSKRLRAMVSEMKEAGFTLPQSPGFRAPMDSHDASTEQLLQELMINHNLVFMGTSDARLPYFANAEGGAAKSPLPMVVLPRTQSGPEDLMDTEPEAGLKFFLAELDLSDRMAALSIISVSGQSLLSKEQTKEIFDYLKARRNRIWLATATQVADWWRERARVNVVLEPALVGIQLKVTVKGERPLGRAATVWVNLPQTGSVMRLLATSGSPKVPLVVSVDRWRSAVVLDGLAPGDYQWSLYFESPSASAGR